MSRKACSCDNVPIESFWNKIRGQIGPTQNMYHEEIVELADTYIDYYNNKREQETLRWLTPKEYETKFTA